GSDDAVAQLLLEAGHQRQGDHQRHHADRHAQRRDRRDDRDESLLPLREEVPEGDVQLERQLQPRSGTRRHTRQRIISLYAFHELSVRFHVPPSTHSRFRINGNRITSRIDGLLVSSITSRSIPTPSPPVGGRPYSRARM